MKQKFPWLLVIILILNLLIHIIPQEWIIGPAPSVEALRQEAEAWTLRQKEPAAEILLNESRWTGMNDREKTRVLEQLAREQAASLGLRKHMDVKVEDLEEGLAGEYRNDSATICIDTESFTGERPERLMYIICHEVRHAYQFALADAWVNLCEDSRYAELEVFDDMKASYEGLNNYCRASEDREAYENQWVEEDARKYADKQLMKILMGEE